MSQRPQKTFWVEVGLVQGFQSREAERGPGGEPLPAGRSKDMV